MRGTTLIQAVAPVLLVTVAACDATSTDRRPVSVSFSSQSPALTGNRAPNFDVTVNAGGNTVIITKAQLVVRSIELKQAMDDVCVDDPAVEDGCEEVEIGPFLVDLPLTQNGVQSITASLPTGTYSEIEFDIHKPGDDVRDVAFKTTNPTFADISIRVEGTFNGSPFTFTSALNESHELEFATPIVIDADNKNITIQVDVSTWFKVGTTVVNPNTANSGQPNENAVRDNIRASLRALEDDDRNGH